MRMEDRTAGLMLVISAAAALFLTARAAMWWQRRSDNPCDWTTAVGDVSAKCARALEPEWVWDECARRLKLPKEDVRAEYGTHYDDLGHRYVRCEREEPRLHVPQIPMGETVTLTSQPAGPPPCVATVFEKDRCVVWCENSDSREDGLALALKTLYLSAADAEMTWIDGVGRGVVMVVGRRAP